jgi:methylenetetrahydrofolate dehydrogenase (NADP+)/methenyltetrahydrofolate cyclohydrolase
MTKVFDGKALAKRIEKGLKGEVGKLKKKGITPKLVSIMVGNGGGSELYLSIKKRAAERIGAELIIKNYGEDIRISELVHEIKVLNETPDINGVMIQLPLPKSLTKKDREKFINAIAKEKDVDGLRDDSPFLTPVVKAVLLAIKEAPLKSPAKLVVVGAEGFEGKKIVRVLKEMDYDVVGLDIGSKNMKKTTQSADILISVTGSPAIIGKDDIKKDAVVIDVGSPKGDVDFESVKDKVSFITPVPGGIGPVTVACLMENLVESARGK